MVSRGVMTGTFGVFRVAANSLVPVVWTAGAAFCAARESSMPSCSVIHGANGRTVLAHADAMPPDSDSTGAINKDRQIRFTKRGDILTGAREKAGTVSGHYS